MEFSESSSKTPFLLCTVICGILDLKSLSGSSQRNAPLMVRMKYDRFLQAVSEHVTIISRCCFDRLTIFFAQNTWRLPISRNAFPINFYRIRKHIRVLKNKREIKNYEKSRVIGLFCYMWVFRCNMRVFPISYK